MSSAFIDGAAPVLPTRLTHLTDWTWHKISIGRSDATTWRIEQGGERLFLKIAPIHPLSETPGEVARLQWLADTSIKAPRLHDTFDANDRHWVLMTALPGADLTHMVDHPTELCHALAGALRAVHGLDVATCPFDHRLASKLAIGAAHVDAGLVDESDFDDQHDGWTAQAVLAWLRQHRPSGEDLVVAHGDASLPNIMAANGKFSGIIDCGRLGVADRWQDLAIACRSIVHNCGQAQVPLFLDAYGAAWDEERYRYYSALDELF